MIKKSVIWSISKEEFQKLYDENSTATAILDYFGLKNRGNNFKTLKKRVIEDNICLKKHEINSNDRKMDHVKYMKSQSLRKDIPLADWLVQNSQYKSGSSLKKRLIKDGMIKNECAKCGLGPKWQGEKLSLQLEHKNGVSDDNRLENLCLLCPNCHSQTPTFAGKKLRKLNKKKRKRIGRINSSFDRNASRIKTRKVEWPTKELLQKLLWENPTVEIAKIYGVSDKSVEKWTKRYGLTKPPRGYWTKFKNKDKGKYYDNSRRI